MEAGMMVPTPSLVEERLNLVNQIRSLPEEIQFNVLGQMNDAQLLNVCLIDVEMLDLCWDPYMRISKNWSNEEFIIFKLGLLARCKYTDCQILRDELDQELKQYTIKDVIIFKLKALPNRPFKEYQHFKDKLEQELNANVNIMNILKNISVRPQLGVVNTLLKTKVDLKNGVNIPVDLDYFVNLNELHVGHMFNQPIDLRSMTKLTRIVFGDRFNQPLNKLPNSLTDLTARRQFNQQIDLRYLNNLTNISFGPRFNQPLNYIINNVNITALPISIEKISFGFGFNQSIDFRSLINLTTLSLGLSFNKPLDKLPINLEHIKFGNSFNQPIDLRYLAKLEDIVFGNNFNKPVDKLPINLRSIVFGDSFNQQVDLIYLTKLKDIVFGTSFNQLVDKLPDGIENINFGQKFNQSINDLPNSVIEIIFDIDGTFDKNITTVYLNLTSLVLPTNYQYRKEVFTILGKSKISPSKILREQAPDLFVPGYIRAIGFLLDRLPRILSLNEIRDYHNGTLIIGDGIRPDQVLPFPKDNHKWYFVPRSAKYPFIGVKENKSLPNNDIYPYIPAGFKTDQIDPHMRSKYNLYYRGIKLARSHTHRIRR